MSEPDLKVKADYWTKRLEHTLNHTHEASKLIFTIDGAALALVGFAVKAFEGPTRLCVTTITLLVLAAISFLHVRFICVQRSWYSGIDGKLRALVKEEAVDHENYVKPFASTHLVHIWIHRAVGIGLLALTVVAAVTLW